MKILDQELDTGSAFSYAGLIERVEILRLALRWASHLERPEIEKLLRQATSLRDEVMHLSHKERFVRAAAAAPARTDLSQRQSVHAPEAAQHGADKIGVAGIEVAKR